MSSLSVGEKKHLNIFQRFKSALKKHWTSYLFISPFFILFFIFGIFPIFFSIVLSFQRWNGISAAQFIGFRNYYFLFQDPDFWLSILNTFIIWIESTVPMVFLALVIAFLLNSKKIQGLSLFRNLFFLPNVTSIVAVAIVFSTLFGNKYGLINFFFQKLNLDPIRWLNIPKYIQIVISTMVVWRWTGYNAIIILAGLQKIDESLYEAARLDGASTFTIFRKITIPLLNPIIIFVVITSTIGGLQLFTEPQVLVGNSGGTGGAGLTIVLYLYRQGFVNNSFGYAAAISWMLFFIIGIFSIFNYFVVRRDND